MKVCLSSAYRPHNYECGIPPSGVMLAPGHFGRDRVGRIECLARSSGARIGAPLTSISNHEDRGADDGEEDKYRHDYPCPDMEVPAALGGNSEQSGGGNEHLVWHCSFLLWRLALRGICLGVDRQVTSRRSVLRDAISATAVVTPAMSATVAAKGNGPPPLRS
jgi:hypothetical protein